MIIVDGKNIDLRYVEVSDAEFIYNLRMDKKLNKFLSKTSGTIEDQEKWINNYKKREKSLEEYYFIIQNKDSEPIGVVRVYNIEEKTLEWGSWILDYNKANPILVVQSILLVYKFIFEMLKYKKLHLEVRKENKEVVFFHKSYGAYITSEDDENIYFAFDNYEKIKKKYARYI